MRPNSLVLIVHNDKLLAQKGIDSVTGLVFYRLMGGGIEFGETSLAAAQREFKEELGVTLTNETLLKVVENIFDYQGQKGHEITFLYTADVLEEEVYQKEIIPRLDVENKYAEWVSIQNIKEQNIKIFPVETIEFI